MADDLNPPRVSYHGNVARGQARVLYGNVHGDVYYGDGVQPKRDIAREILASLRFPGMDRYHERPLDSFPGTYEWIFDGISTNFKQWLTGSDEVYWVNGKAGSGKSCLMKLISEHDRTAELLEDWAGGQVTIVPFFFWAAGGELEKSQLGLMRSLLFQILDQYSDLAQICLPQRWAAHERRSDYEKPWSHSELQKGLSMVLRNERMTSRFFFLVDGLDEFDGDHQDLIDCLETLNTSNRVKLLVSSRPWNVFHAAYGRPDQAWRLRLQDLTSKDMDLFIISRFESDPRFKALMERERSRPQSNATYRLHRLGIELREMAEGVFLWVDLVIKTLRRGLSEHDTLAGLSKRLMLLPKEIDAMLQHIFDSIEPVYQQLAARCFLILHCTLSHWKGVPLTWTAYLDHELESASSDMSHFDAHELERNEHGLQAVEQMVRRCCRDLVDIHHHEDNPEETKLFPEDFVGSAYLRYGHKTVFDFIGSKIENGCLQGLAGPGFDPVISTCRLLVQVSAPSLPENFASIVGHFMSASMKVRDFKQSEAELVSLSKQLIDIGAALDNTGHSLCDSLQGQVLELIDLYFEDSQVRIDMDDDLRLLAGTLVGCAALLTGQERLFWSLVATNSIDGSDKTTRTWMACALSNAISSICDRHSRDGSWTPMKLYDKLCGVDEHARSRDLTKLSPSTRGIFIQDLCVKACMDAGLFNPGKRQFDPGFATHMSIFLASRRAALEKFLVYEGFCKAILDWGHVHVDLEALALSSPSPSYTVELSWGGYESTELVYDEHEFLRQFWPSFKKVQEYCQGVLAKAPGTTSSWSTVSEAETEMENERPESHQENLATRSTVSEAEAEMENEQPDSHEENLATSSTVSEAEAEMENESPRYYPKNLATTSTLSEAEAKMENERPKSHPENLATSSTVSEAETAKENKRPKFR